MSLMLSAKNMYGNNAKTKDMLTDERLLCVTYICANSKRAPLQVMSGRVRAA